MNEVTAVRKDVNSKQSVLMGSIIKIQLTSLFCLKFQFRAHIEIRIPLNTWISYLSFGMGHSNFLAQVFMCSFYPILMIHERM
jgi:hypothetical protein